MDRTITLALVLCCSLAGCASTRPAEQEPLDPPDEEVTGEIPVGDDAGGGMPGLDLGEPAGEGPMPGLDLGAEPEAGDGPAPAGAETGPAPGDALPSPAEPEVGSTAAPLENEPGACPAGRAPLVVKLLVFLRHPADPVPALPAGGFTLAVDGAIAATGVQVGQVHTLCVAPGEHEVAALGGSITRTVRAQAPGKAQLAVAGGKAPAPGIAPAAPAREGTP
jgi:hypothetical protein